MPPSLASSQGEFTIILYNNHALVSWKSRKTQRAVRSTLAAETLAMEEAVEERFII